MTTRTHLVTGLATTNPEPRLHFDETGVTLWHGDCIEVMSLLPDESLDAVVTDPPYGLEFMGRDWDTFKPSGDVIRDPASVGGFQDGNGGNPFSRSRIRYGTKTGGTVENSVDEGTDASHPFRDGSTRIRYGRGDLRAFEDWCADWAEQAFRVLKPGAHLLAFGGSRTWHRLAAGIEDAGFDIRDSIAWVYASGFPKSRDTTAAMEDYIARGPVEPERPGVLIRPGVYDVTRFLRDARDRAGWTNRQIDELFGTRGMSGHWTSQASQPAVPSVRQWEVLKASLGFDDSMDALVAELGSTERPEDWGSGPGDQGRFLAGLSNNPDADPAGSWGSALKPAFEPIVVARKPFPGSLDQNARRYGTGSLNIGATRVGETGGTRAAAGSVGSGTNTVYGQNMGGNPHDPDYEAGRWPTNLVISHAPECDIGCAPGCPVAAFAAASPLLLDVYPVFRYEPKAPTRERPAVIDEQGNVVQHPTVKPLDLMRWLIRLVVPRGATILEPFAGSGTTAEAAVIEGVGCVAIELGADHLPLILERLERQPSVIADRMTRGEHRPPEGVLF